MKKNNSERLTQNQNETKTNIEKHLQKDHQNHVNNTDGLKNAIFFWVNEKINDSEFSIALEELRDLNMGITWSIYNNHEDGTMDLIRDARNQSVDKIEEARVKGQEYSIVIGSLNVYRAAKKYVECSNLSDEKKQNIYQKLKNILKQDIKNLLDNTGANFQHVIDGYMNVFKDEENIEGIRNNIEIARDFVSMDSPQFHISTITGSRDHVVIESETALLGLTEEIINRYNDRTHQDWYHEQKDFVKKLIDQYSQKILEGNINLPIQGLQILPGIRNAYNKTTYIKTKDGLLKALIQSSHSGTVTFDNKNDEENNITKENIEQLKSFYPLSKVWLNSYNHKVSKIISDQTKHDESNLINPIEKNKGDCGIKFSYTT
ncbi:MAG: hypothetical protein ACI8ZF_000149 [Candidatus Midichloriaceae bacterium]|jgi:hypothetical protein